MYGKVNYKTIHESDLLIYTQNFCDKEGKLSKPPFAPTWPDEMLTTVSFHSEGPEETRITLRWEIYGEASDEERKTFNEAKAGIIVSLLIVA